MQYINPIYQWFGESNTALSPSETTMIKSDLALSPIPLNDTIIVPAQSNTTAIANLASVDDIPLPFGPIVIIGVVLAFIIIKMICITRKRYRYTIRNDDPVLIDIDENRGQLAIEGPRVPVPSQPPSIVMNIPPPPPIPAIPHIAKNTITLAPSDQRCRMLEEIRAAHRKQVDGDSSE